MRSLSLSLEFWAISIFTQVLLASSHKTRLLKRHDSYLRSSITRGTQQRPLPTEPPGRTADAWNRHFKSRIPGRGKAHSCHHKAGYAGHSRSQGPTNEHGLDDFCDLPTVSRPKRRCKGWQDGVEKRSEGHECPGQNQNGNAEVEGMQLVWGDYFPSGTWPERPSRSCDERRSSSNLPLPAEATSLLVVRASPLLRRNKVGRSLRAGWTQPRGSRARPAWWAKSILSIWGILSDSLFIGERGKPGDCSKKAHHLGKFKLCWSHRREGETVTESLLCSKSVM